MAFFCALGEGVFIFAFLVQALLDFLGLAFGEAVDVVLTAVQFLLELAFGDGVGAQAFDLLHYLTDLLLRDEEELIGEGRLVNNLEVHLHGYQRSLLSCWRFRFGFLSFACLRHHR